MTKCDLLTFIYMLKFKFWDLFHPAENNTNYHFQFLTDRSVWLKQHNFRLRLWPVYPPKVRQNFTIFLSFLRCILFFCFRSPFASVTEYSLLKNNIVQLCLELTTIVQQVLTQTHTHKHTRDACITQSIVSVFIWLIYD